MNIIIIYYIILPIVKFIDQKSSRIIVKIFRYYRVRTIWKKRFDFFILFIHASIKDEQIKDESIFRRLKTRRIVDNNIIFYYLRVYEYKQTKILLHHIFFFFFRSFLSHLYSDKMSVIFKIFINTPHNCSL